MDINLTANDLSWLGEQGILPEMVKKQYRQLCEGFPALNVLRAAIEGDGIEVLDDNQLRDYATLWHHSTEKKGLRVVKFVPASGAATRMFKDLQEWLNNDDEEPSKVVEQVIANLECFAFFEALQDACFVNYGKSAEEMREQKMYAELVDLLLNEDGLNMANQPKATLLFHQYDDESRTPFMEQIVEGKQYATADGKFSIHFTISPEHKALFEQQKTFALTAQQDVDITFSQQKSSTNTIALYDNGELVRDKDGHLKLRPGGHGALIANLSELDADIVFVKNIDNIAPEHLQQDTILYKQALAGMLLELRELSFQYYVALNDNPTDENCAAAEEFVTHRLHVNVLDIKSLNKDCRRQKLMEILNRPIRVCGMVNNSGEPGGGPFIVRNDDNTESLQILESVQITNSKREELFAKPQQYYFNPVDMVCSLTDSQGRHYDLNNFVDENAAFLSSKSIDGKSIKALELPGLWNGAMSRWNTIFVAVPETTFTPVKTIVDLLRSQHQPN